MVALLTTHQAGTVAFTPCAVVGQGDFQRSIRGLGPGIGIKDLVELFRRQTRDFFRQLKHSIGAGLEAQRVIQCGHLLLHRLDDFRVAVAQPAGPQSGKSIVQFAAVCRVVVVALGADKDSRLFFEIPVSRERHPVGFQ